MQQPKKEPDFLKNFSNELSEEFRFIKEELSNEIYFNEITPDIFLLSCLERTSTMLYRVISSFISVSEISSISDFIRETISQEFIVPLRSGRNIQFSDKMNSLLQKAESVRKELGHQLMTTDHILLAMLSSSSEGEIVKTIENLGITYDFAVGISKELHSVIEETISNQNENKNLVEPIEIPTEILPKIKKEEGFLSLKQEHTSIQYCKPMLAVDGCETYPDIVGRERELSELIKMLSRKTMNNALLVGDNGVGKTSVVRKLINAIATNACPIDFRRKEVLLFDYMGLISGTQMRGEFEGRVTKLMSDLSKKKNIILYIPTIHSILTGRMRDNYDFTGFLSYVFSSQRIMVIGETTHTEYHKTIESIPEISNGLQIINISQPSESDCFEIIKKQKHSFEDFHNVTYSDEIISSCIDLSKRYITEKQLPSSAIDIIDEAGAIKKSRNPLLEELIEYKSKENALILKKQYEKNNNIENLEKEINSIKLKCAEIENKLSCGTENNVTIDDIRTAISEHTGIPIKRVTTNDIKEISELNNIIKKTVVGQDAAVDSVCMAIKRNKIGLCQENKPILSAMFIGGTGTGKTLLAKTIAREVFGGDDSLIRIDMSEYSDKTSVNKLIGSSAGYVGYEEGGILTEAVKKKKNAVILIDEVEKSTDEVFNVFLQVLDEGFLSDNTGRKVDFRNTIILMTSNIGVRRSHEERGIGFTMNADTFKKEIIEKEMKNKFSPEFLNRIDEIIYFNPLTEENFLDIINIELSRVAEKMHKIGYSVNYDESIKSILLKEALKKKEYGARPIAKIIKKLVEDEITKLILEQNGEDVIEGFNVNVEENKIKIDIKYDSI